MTSYLVELLTKAGEWLEEPVYCNARLSASIIRTRLCAVPMELLRAEPFSLEFGDEVKARVAAANIVGLSAFSESSTVNALIQTAPFAPLTAPREGSLTTTSEIHIVLDAVLGAQSGNSPVLSYQIDCDMGVGQW